MLKIDEALLKLCKEGNHVAQMQVYDNYCQAMYNVACHYLLDEDAKDAMQEGFLKAFLRIDTFKPESSFGAWLKRIIINQCLDVLKKKQIRFDNVEVNDLKIETEPDWFFDTSITKEHICNAVEKLNPKYKIVVKLYLLEGYDHEEISEILGIPIKTSRTHLRRGRLKLQELLKTKYDEAGY